MTLTRVFLSLKFTKADSHESDKMTQNDDSLSLIF